MFEGLGSCKDTNRFIEEGLGGSSKIIEVIHSSTDSLDDSLLFLKIGLDVHHSLLGVTFIKKTGKTEGKDGSEEFFSVVYASN